jgi:hypothetical protein
MRIEKVPIDMASEQKEILGLFSKRQLTYIAVGGLLIYSYVPSVYKLFSVFGWIAGGLAALITAVPVAAIFLFLAFAKVQKLNMNRDYYYYIRFQRRTQYGSWRKGR